MLCAQRMSLIASEKNSAPPKLPDFSATSMSPAVDPTARSTGTPAAISIPTRNPGIFNRSTTAPDVSPPATINRRTPDFTRLSAMSAIVCSIACPAASRPWRAWSAATLAGVALDAISTGPRANRSFAQSSARCISPAPVRIRSVSRCNTGMTRSALSICCKVACEQLPARHATCPSTTAPCSLLAAADLTLPVDTSARASPRPMPEAPTDSR